MNDDRDHSLDTLLDLHGQTMVIDDGGTYWVKFEVKSCVVTPERPHGLRYSLTLHNADGERLVGFDNAHGVTGTQGPAAKSRIKYDHTHRFKTVRPYEYQDAATLLGDFWTVVDAVLKELGVQT